MAHNTVKIDTRQIRDWDSFHDVFQRAFGFPNFYGKNMNAWIDCMTSLDSPEHGMSSVHAPKDGVVLIEMDSVDDFAQRCPEIYAAVLECSAFVNWRRMEQKENPVLALSFWRQNP